MLYTNRLKALPPIPIDKMKRGKRNYLAVAQVIDEEKCGRVLVFDVYIRATKQLAVRFFCDGTNYKVYDVAKDKWFQRRVRGVLADSKDYCYYTYNSQYKAAASDATFKVVKDFFKDRWRHWESEDIFANLDRFCEDKSTEKRNRYWENKHNRIKAHMDMFPDLPKDFGNFLREYVFRGYMFVSKVVDGKRTGVCTYCRKKISLSKDIRNKTVIECPKCHKQVTTWKDWCASSIKEKKTVCVACRVENQLLLRWMEVTDSWDKNIKTGKLEPCYDINEYYRTMYLNEKKGPVIRNYRMKNVYPWGAEWRDHQWDQDDTAYVYTYNLEEVFGDVYYKVNIKKELEKCPQPLHFKRLLNNLKNNAATEYLVKMGMPRLASQIRESDIREGRDFGTILGINPQYKKMFSNRNVSLDEYHMVQAAREWVSDEDFMKMRTLNPNSWQVGKIIDLLQTMSYRRLVNYFTKQKTLYHPRTLDQILRWYEDYINMSEQMQIDLSRKSVRFPKDIKEAHDNLSKKFTLVKNEIYDEQLRRASKNLYAGLTEYKSDGYAIVFPRTRTEFIIEGQSLSHCVGSQEMYFKNHLEGKKMIFFIRHEAEIDKPFVTMEIDMERCVILQIYGYGDKRPAPEVRNFANKFLRQLKRKDTDVRRTA